jgi:hypothetical protein
MLVRAAKPETCRSSFLDPQAGQASRSSGVPVMLSNISPQASQQYS